MSKKLISGALHSPSLIGDLQEHYKSQAKNTTRRLVVVLLSFLFLLLQYVAFIPSSNSSSAASEIIPGGIASRQNLLFEYDNNSSNFYKSAKALSIERQDISTLQETDSSKWAKDKSTLIIVWNKLPIYKYIQQTQATKNSPSFVAIDPDSRQQIYGHLVPLGSFVNSRAKLLAGNYSDSKPLAVLKDSGNIVTTDYDSDTCYKSPTISSYGVCPNSNTFEGSLVVKNLDYKTEANFIKNKPNNTLEFIVKNTNLSGQAITVKPRLYIGDMLEYANLNDPGLARFDEKSQTLEWQEETISSRQENSQIFKLKVQPNTALNVTASTDFSTYDCTMTSYYGKKLDIKVHCPPVKQIERIAHAPYQPSTLLLAWVVLALNIVLYLRAHVLAKENALILRELKRRKHD